jgi:hypothetical protein
VTITDIECNNTKLRLCFKSDALFIAGIRILLVGRVVKKIKKARAAAVLLIVKLSNITNADIPKTYP